MLDGFTYAWPLAIEHGYVLCKVLNSSGYVAFAHTVVTIYVVPTFTFIR
jgi:hypothetical protein